MIACAVSHAMFCRVQPRCVAKLFGVTTSSATMRALSGFGCRFGRAAVVVVSVIARSSKRKPASDLLPTAPALQGWNSQRSDILIHRRGAVPPEGFALQGPCRPIAEGRHPS